jgi:hypothetical protein
VVNCFFEFLNPFALGARNFINYIMFLMIFNAPNVPKVVVQVLLEHKKNEGLPLDLACPECLNVQSPNSLLELSYICISFFFEHHHYYYTCFHYSY